MIPAVLALAAGIGWIAFSDAVKAANAYAALFTSTNLRAWVYGSLAQRWDPAFWSMVGHEFSVGVLSGSVGLILLVGRRCS